MINSRFSPHRHQRAGPFAIAISYLLIGLNAACVSAAPQNEEAVVAAIRDGTGTASAGMTLAELEDQLRRFADRYYTRINLATNVVRAMPLTTEEHALMQGWYTVSYATSVDLAIGRDPVTNLLDFMVLTTLSRLVIENHWMPEVLGDEKSRPLLSAAVALEEDIWTIADNVLDSEQQAELLLIITEWQNENPDQVYPWLIRMSEFSGQRAARLNAIKETGGLLKEVRKARETAEDLQAFGERVLFYMQRAPGITANVMETSVLQLLNDPSIQGLLEQTERFVQSAEQLSETVDALPRNRLAAVDQLLEGLSEERRAFLNDVAAAAPETHAILTELRQSLEAIERLVDAAGLADENVASEPVDIAEYRMLATEVANSALEIRLLAQALNDTVRDAPAVVSVLDELVAREQQVVNHTALIITGLIVFFFMMLLAYRYVAARLVPI
jgi:hypothetical protein